MTAERGRSRRIALACAVLSCVLVLFAVVCSDDMQHPDEHFQTMELASWKLGRTPFDALPWEFEARMRPWLQPAAYLLVFRLLGAPFTVAMVCRASSALLTIAASFVLSRAIWATVVVPRARLVAIGTLWLGFWVPYLAVRTSSETTAAAFMGMGIGGLILEGRAHARPRTSRLLLVGLALGLAFELRFQTGIMSAGVLAWLFGPGRSGRLAEDLRRAALVAGGLAGAVGLGRCVDRWGYGAWTFAPWNYVHENLVKGAAAEFGTSPPFSFLWTAHAPATIVVTVPLMVLVAVGWIRGRRHVATWAAVPFFLVHALLSHKETRFLFPLLGLSALHVGLALDGAVAERLRGSALRYATWAIGAVNVLAVLASPFVVRFPMLDCQRFLSRTHGAVSQAVLLDDPYDYGDGLALYAWRPPHLTLVPRGEATPGERAWIVAKEPLAPMSGARVVYQTPRWRTWLGSHVGGGRTDERWVVLEPP